MNTKVRYKVVKKSRYSAIVNGNSKYALRYLPGLEIHALPNTLGIFLFKHKYQADNWCDVLNYKTFSYYPYGDNCTVIEVLPLERGRAVNCIPAVWTDTDALDTYYENEKDFSRFGYTPDGTYTHMSVRVLN